jgi:type I restriction enzyme, S subunit
MKWKAYPEYRESGIQWLEQIPEHWAEEKLKFIAKVTPSNVDKDSNEEEQPVSLCNYTDVYHNEFINSEMKLMRATASLAEIEKFQLKPGDVLVTKDSEEWSDIAVPAYIVSSANDTLCGYHLAQIRPLRSNISGEYLFRAFSARGINDQFRVEANGITRYGLGKYSLDSGIFPVPPLEEQLQIVEVIKKQTNIIDNLIAKKQRQIELLQKKCSALISHVVTKGLDPNVKMKDSGVEWLGEIPEHWEITRLKYIARLQSGKSLTLPDSSDDGDYPIYGGNGQRGYTSSYNYEGEFALIGRQGALCGCINYGKGRFWATEHAVVVIPIGSNFTNWLGSLLQSMNLNRYSQSAAQPGLAVETIASLSIPVPPSSEQIVIGCFINQESLRINELISKLYDSITVLQEYRSALISAAVTGKIDVRQEVA